MDITDTLAPKSDQLDAVDLQSGPRVFTVKNVTKGDAEQPVQVHLVEFPRGPWRPGKNMRRVLAACWGADASAWVGRRVELYCDPAVKYGADLVGGTRIRSLSHIDKAQTVLLIVSRGKGGSFIVQPLAAVSQPGGQSHVTPSQDPPGLDRSTMPGTSATETAAPEAPSSPEPLVAAVNRQIREIQAEDGAAHLRTWADSVGVKASSQAIAEKYGDAARDLRWLIGETTNA